MHCKLASQGLSTLTPEGTLPSSLVRIRQWMGVASAGTGSKMLERAVSHMRCHGGVVLHDGG